MRLAHTLPLLLLSATSVLGQGPAPAEPQVHPDRSVTFRADFPGATAVDVLIDALPAPIPMQKNAAGLWTATTPPLAPEIYSFHFQLNPPPYAPGPPSAAPPTNPGVTALDAADPLIKSGELAPGSGFLVPGTPPEPWELTAVAHGVVHRHVFTTSVVQGLPFNQSTFYVYTPPGYDPRASTKYPVLYLLHGWSDTAAGWTEVGRANNILDALIATGRAKPMIVVMPLGYGQMSFVHSGFGVWQDSALIDANTALFERSLLTEVMPRAEALYSIAPGRDNHAIAGLSMGGLESLSIGLNHTALFAYIGGFSSAVHKLQPGNLSHLDPRTADLRLLWIACGTSDGLLEPNRHLIATLKAEGLPVTPIETPGAHIWQVWRDNLVHFAPLLFQTTK